LMVCLILILILTWMEHLCLEGIMILTL
jgi:hypothetical protein